MALYQIFKDFIQNTSVGGIQRVFHPVGNQPPAKYFRLVWLLSWLAAASYMTYQIGWHVQVSYKIYQIVFYSYRYVFGLSQRGINS